MSVEDGATIAVRSLSPFGERVGVRGLHYYRETITPHPTPLPMGEGADRACCLLMISSMIPAMALSATGRKKYQRAAGAGSVN
jgi:hypothetical protein